MIDHKGDAPFATVCACQQQDTLEKSKSGLNRTPSSSDSGPATITDKTVGRVKHFWRLHYLSPLPPPPPHPLRSMLCKTKWFSWEIVELPSNIE